MVQAIGQRSSGGQERFDERMPDRYASRMDIARAQESLHAAELCLQTGLVNSAVSRAYYAMFQAAQVALETEGIRRPTWSHPSVQAMFTNRAHPSAEAVCSDVP